MVNTFLKTRSPGWPRSKKRPNEALLRAPERTKVHEERRIMTLMKRLAKLVNGLTELGKGVHTISIEKRPKATANRALFELNHEVRVKDR